MWSKLDCTRMNKMKKNKSNTGEIHLKDKNGGPLSRIGFIVSPIPVLTDNVIFLYMNKCQAISREVCRENKSLHLKA